jgi:hypothetical protein
MSPAGVVMLYGSDDAKTAVLEIDDDPKRGIAVGTFRTSREMKLLDLTKLPRRLGFFERQSDSSELNRYTVAFSIASSRACPPRLSQEAVSISTMYRPKLLRNGLERCSGIVARSLMGLFIRVRRTPAGIRWSFSRRDTA